MDLPHQEAALIENGVGLLGHAHQGVPPAADSPHRVGGGVGTHVRQLREGLPELLFVTMETSSLYS